MRMVVLGPKGTYSEKAATAYMPKAKIIFKKTIDDIFNDLEESDLAVVPVQNTLSGYIDESLTHIREERYQILDTFSHEVRYGLVGTGPAKSAKKLYANLHAYRQCYQTLIALGLNCEVIFTQSNGETLEKMQKNTDTNVIGIIANHSLEGFSVLEENIQGSDNSTLFAVLKKVAKE